MKIISRLCCMGFTIFFCLPTLAGSISGGIDGGGGDTLPEDRITIENVYSILNSSKLVLRQHFRALEQKSHSEPQSYDDLLFKSTPTIFNILESIDLEIHPMTPCLDQNGRAVDASIYAATDKAICVSAFLIAPKLIPERASPEIFALLVHELSHLVGLNEEQALSLQVKSRNELRNMDWDQVHVQSIRQAVRFLRLENEIQIDVMKAPSEILLQFERASIAFQGMLFWHKSLAHFVKRDLDYLLYQRAKFFMAMTYVRTLQTNEEAGEWKDKYEGYFAKGSKIKYAELPVFGGGNNNFYGQELIEKINSLLELKKQLNEIHFYSVGALLHFEAMMRGNPLPALPTPGPQWIHPWTSLIGQYVTKAVDCSVIGNPPSRPFDLMPEFQNFEIRPVSAKYPNRLVLMQTTKFGEVIKTPLYNEAIDTEIFVSVQIASERGDRKLFLSQQGDSWDQMKQQTIIFESTDEGFQLIKTYRELKNHAPSVEFQNSQASCTYQLIRK